MIVDREQILFHILQRGSDTYTFTYRAKYRLKMMYAGWRMWRNPELSFDEQDYKQLVANIMVTTEGNVDAIKKYLENVGRFGRDDHD